MRLINFPMDGHSCPLKFGSCRSFITPYNHCETLCGKFLRLISRMSCRRLPHEWDCVHVEERALIFGGGARGVIQPAAVRPDRTDRVQRDAQVQHGWDLRLNTETFNPQADHFNPAGNKPIGSLRTENADCAEKKIAYGPHCTFLHQAERNTLLIKKILFIPKCEFRKNIVL